MRSIGVSCGALYYRPKSPFVAVVSIAAHSTPVNVSIGLHAPSLVSRMQVQLGTSSVTSKQTFCASDRVDLRHPVHLHGFRGIRRTFRTFLITFVM